VEIHGIMNNTFTEEAEGKVAKAAIAENRILPPEKRGYGWQILAGIVFLAGVVALMVYYFRFIVPYESTDDAFIDGYVTTISPRVAGQVAQLMVMDNQKVKEGDVLVEIDPRDYESGLAQARADLAVARSRLTQSQAQVKVGKAKVAVAQAGTGAALAENERATNDLRRYELVQSQARAAAANLQSADSQVAAAESEVALSEAGVETAAAAVQQAEARLQQAELNLSYTKIVAPRSGRVTGRTVQLGNYVQPGQALLTLVPDEMWVIANFKETQLTDLRPGQAADVRVDAYPNRKFKGHVDSLQAGSGAQFSLLPPENAVGNYVKVVQRIPVKIVFDEPLPPDLDIAPGMSVVPQVRVK
jgi:membrane fusion protein (multidrug efflux system)